MHLIGSVNKGMLREVVEALDAAKGKPVTVRITSDGGNSDIAKAIAGLFVAYKGQVITEVFGNCESAATLIFAAGAQRRMQRYAWAMVHQGSTEASGTIDSIRNKAKHVVRMETHWNQILMERTGTAVEVWNKLDRRDTYLNADECLSLNLATEIF